MKCLRCGTELSASALHCGKCGYPTAKGKKTNESSAYRYVPNREKAKETVTPKKNKTEDTSFHFAPDRKHAREYIFGKPDTSYRGTHDKKYARDPIPDKPDTSFHGTHDKKYARDSIPDRPDTSFHGTHDKKYARDPIPEKPDTAASEIQGKKSGQEKAAEKVNGVQDEKNTGKTSSGGAAATTATVKTAQKQSGTTPAKKRGCFGGIVRFFLVVGVVSGIINYIQSCDSATQDKSSISATEETTKSVVMETVAQMETDYIFYSIREMKDKLAPTCIDEDMNVTVRYKGDVNDMYRYAHCYLFGGRAGTITQMEPGVFRITAIPYAGSKMLKAYRTNDYSNLTADEVEALYKAEAVVNAARKTANSDMELELWLHDWMCENISYYDVDFSIEFTDRRQLNAVGALLDGKANCQGYTDCFYLLGNMAGFVVDRQVMPEHIFNTIKLGGNWYIVDVTHDDYDQEQYGREQHIYQYFNVGTDYCDDRTWAYEETRNTISNVSGSYFYYHLEGDYPRFYYSIEELASSAIREYKSGRKLLHMMLYGQRLTNEELFAALNKAARNQGVRYNLYASYSQGIQNTCYTLNFE